MRPQEASLASDQKASEAGLGFKQTRDQLFEGALHRHHPQSYGARRTVLGPLAVRQARHRQENQDGSAEHDCMEMGRRTVLLAKAGPSSHGAVWRKGNTILVRKQLKNLNLNLA